MIFVLCSSLSYSILDWLLIVIRPSTLYTANHDRSLRVVDSKSLKVVDRIECHTDTVTSVTASIGLKYRFMHLNYLN